MPDACIVTFQENVSTFIEGTIACMIVKFGRNWNRPGRTPQVLEQIKPAGESLMKLKSRTGPRRAHLFRRILDT